MSDYSKLTDKVNGRKIQVESAVRDGQGNKIDTRYITSDGYYQQLGAGYADVADNLTPYGENSGVGQEKSFVIQTSAGGSDIGNSAQLRKLLGNTVKFNQLLSNGNFADITGWNSDLDGNSTLSVAYNELSYAITAIGVNYYSNRVQHSIATIPQGSKFLFKAEVYLPKQAEKIYLCPRNSNTFVYIDSSVVENLVVGWNYIGVLIEATSSAVDTLSILFNLTQNSNYAIGDIIKVRNCQAINLTKMYGSGKEPTSVLEFNRQYPKRYYDYDSGTLNSCQSSYYKIIGFNQFDEELEQGSIDENTGANSSSSNMVRSKNYTRVIQGEKYKLEFSTLTILDGIMIIEYDIDNNCVGNKALTDLNGYEYTASSVCSYIRLRFYRSGGLTPSQLSNVCFHLVWGGERNGEYEEYNEKSYTLPNEKLRSVGTVKDEITPNGIKTTKVGSYTFTGSEEWLSYGSGYRTIVLSGKEYKSITDTVVPTNVDSDTDLAIVTRLSISNGGSGISIVGDTIIVSDTTGLTGKTINYELAVSTETQVNSYTENTEIDDFGIQLFDSQIEQGSYFFYPVDYKAFIDSLGQREDIGYDANEIVSKTELQEAISEIPTPTMTDKLDTSFSGVSEYDSSTSYTTGNKCWYNGKIYVATDNTTGDFDSTKWTEVTLSDYVDLSSAQTITGVKTYPNHLLTKYEADDYHIINYRVGGDYFKFKIAKYQTNTVQYGVQLSNSSAFEPINNNDLDLGSSSNKWKYLYLSGGFNPNANGYKLTIPDTTSFASNKEIATTDQAFNVINASDIVNNTLTQAQYDLITNGKPTLIKGTFLSRQNVLLLSPIGTTATLYGMMFSNSGNRPRLGEYTISNSFVINENTSIYQRLIELNQIETINGKSIPNYPSNTGTFVLKCVDGTLTWVQE